MILKNLEEHKRLNFLNLEERKQIYKDNRANSLKLVNQRRSLSNLEPFASYEDFENFIDDEDFEIDAEIDQSAKILYEIIEAKSNENNIF